MTAKQTDLTNSELIRSIIRELVRIIATILIRIPYLRFLRETGKLPLFLTRVDFLEIGENGTVTSIDLIHARDLRLQPLNWFERWIAIPMIAKGRLKRQANPTRAFMP